MKPDTKVSLGLQILLAVLLGWLAIKIISRIGDAFDFLTGDTEKDDKAAEKALNSDSFKFFNTTFGFNVIKNKFGSLSNYFLKINFKVSDATIIAQNIIDSYGFVNDREQKLYMAFGQIPTQAALSLVANQFIVLYPKGGGLLNFIDFLDGQELLKVEKILKNKPVF